MDALNYAVCTLHRHEVVKENASGNNQRLISISLRCDHISWLPHKAKSKNRLAEYIAGPRFG